jgi:hypothetical protein
VLTVGSCSLVRNGRLSCLFGLLSSLSPSLSYFIYLPYCIILHSLFACIYYLIFTLLSYHCIYYLAFITLSPSIYCSTFIIFHYYLTLHLLSCFYYHYHLILLHSLSIDIPYHKYHKSALYLPFIYLFIISSPSIMSSFVFIMHIPFFSFVCCAYIHLYHDLLIVSCMFMILCISLDGSPFDLSQELHSLPHLAFATPPPTIWPWHVRCGV